MTAGTKVEIDESQDLNIVPVADRPISRDVGNSSIGENAFDLTSKSHVKGTHEQSDPTEVTNSEEMNDTTSTLEMNDLQDANNTRVGKYNFRHKPNPKYSHFYHYSKCKLPNFVCTKVLLTIQQRNIYKQISFFKNNQFFQ